MLRRSLYMLGLIILSVPSVHGQVLWEGMVGNSFFNPLVGGFDGQKHIAATSVEDLFVTEDGRIFTGSHGGEPIFSINAVYQGEKGRAGFFLPHRTLVSGTEAICFDGTYRYYGERTVWDWQDQEFMTEGGLYVVRDGAENHYETKLLKGKDVRSLALHEDVLYVGIGGDNPHILTRSIKDLEREVRSWNVTGVPRKMAVGKKGAVWTVLEYARANKVLCLSPAGETISELPLDFAPSAIAIHDTKPWLYIGSKAETRTSHGIAVYDVVHPTNPRFVERIGVPEGFLARSGTHRSGQIGPTRFGRIVDLEHRNGRLYIVNQYFLRRNEPTAHIVVLNDRHKKVFDIQAMLFCENVLPDPEDPTNLYGGFWRFSVDLTKRKQDFYTFDSVTVDEYAYPEDIRLWQTKLFSYSFPAAIWREDGRKFIAITMQWMATGGIFEIQENTDILKPVAAWISEPSPDESDEWPEHAPIDRATGRKLWSYWHDLDSDGTMNPDEFGQWNEDMAPGGGYVDNRVNINYIDTQGDLWGWRESPEDGTIYFYDINVGEKGLRVPTGASAIYPMPEEDFEKTRCDSEPVRWGGISSYMFYVPKTDELYFLGWNTKYPHPESRQGTGELPWDAERPVGLIRYDNFRTNYPSIEPVYNVEVPWRSREYHGQFAYNIPFSGAGTAIDIDVEEDFVFITYSYGLIRVHERATGAYHSDIKPLNMYNAKCDAGNKCLNVVYDDKKHEYVLYQEAIYNAGSNVIRWSPPKRKPKGVGLQKTSVNNALKTLKAIWNHAIKLGLFTGENPVAQVERYKVPKTLDRDYLDGQQIDILLSAAREHSEDRYVKKKDAHNAYLAIALMALAGLRKREACFARWEWIDWNSRILTVTNDETG